MSLFTCGCAHHHGRKTAVEAVGGIAAVHRAVGLRLVGAALSAEGAAVHGVAHVRLSYQLMHCRKAR